MNAIPKSVIEDRIATLRRQVQEAARAQVELRLLEELLRLGTGSIGGIPEAIPPQPIGVPDDQPVGPTVAVLAAVKQEPGVLQLTLAKRLATDARVHSASKNRFRLIYSTIDLLIKRDRLRRDDERRLYLADDEEDRGGPLK